MLLAAAVSTTVAQSSSELPPLAYESFSTEIRESVRQAYEAAKAKPRDPETVGRVGRTLHTYEQHEAAALFYERAHQLAPKEFRWLYYLGIVQAAVGKHADAVSTYRAAAQFQPDSLLVQLRLADSLLALGQWQESQPLYEAIRKKDAQIAQAHYGLGRIAILQKNTTAAITHFRQALLIFVRYGAAHYALGMALRDVGQRSEAQEHLSLAQQFKYIRPALDDPLVESLAELNMSATGHLKRGVAFSEMGNLQQAIAEHEQALEIDPKYTLAHINLIQLFGRAGQPAKAEEHYRSAIKIDPNHADSHYNYGVLLTGQERFTEATQAFQRSLQLNPFNAEAHHNYAVMVEREGRLEEAALHYQKAIENNPNHRLSHFHLGRILVHQEKLAEAITHFQLTLTPEDADTPRFTYALGATYARTGEKQKALEYLRLALQKAKAFGQTTLVSSLERDLRNLEMSDGQKP
ncbi:MAG: tetratricopeptide repeat protein [Blastocatellia bacterium]|nr:tetratricopeptide repeat protein [Blastocatellia bacterium]